MIPPVGFIWRQLNGPQITGICNALYHWIKSMIDKTLDYWRNFSISTANSAHLTTLGILMNLGRPKIEQLKQSYILFASNYFRPSAQGFTAWDKQQLLEIAAQEGITGEPQVGRFTDLDNTDDMAQTNYIEDPYYRALLKAADGRHGEMGSLAFLDETIYQLYIYDQTRGGQVTDYSVTYEYQQEPDVGQDRTYGDITVDLGYSRDYNDILRVVSVVQVLTKGTYAPVPRIFINIRL